MLYIYRTIFCRKLVYNRWTSWKQDSRSVPFVSSKKYIIVWQSIGIQTNQTIDYIVTKYHHTTKCNATLSIYKADKTGHNYVHIAPADNSSFDADPSSWYAYNNLHYKSIFWFNLLVPLIYKFLNSVLYKLIILYYMLVFRPFMAMHFLLQYDFLTIFFLLKLFLFADRHSLVLFLDLLVFICRYHLI